MKKYLTLAAVMGVAAFAGASYFANATEVKTEAAVAVGEAHADATTVDQAAKDKAECEATASAKKDGGAEPTTEEKDAAIKKCMEDKTKAAETAPTDAMKPAVEAPEHK